MKKTTPDSIAVFEREHERLQDLLQAKLSKFNETTRPLRTEMGLLLEHSPFEEFGEYLNKVLGMCVNSKAIEADELSVQNGFYYKPMRGRRQKIVPERLLYAISPEFVKCTRNEKKNRIVQDFLVFKAATEKTLEEFYKPIVIKPNNLSLDTIKTGYLVMGDTVVAEDKHKSKLLYYIQNQEKVTPSFISLSFTEAESPWETSVSRATNPTNSKKGYIAHLAVFAPNPEHPEHDQLAGYAAIRFHNPKEDPDEFDTLLEFQLYQMTSSQGRYSRDALSIQNWSGTYFQSQNLYSEPYGHRETIQIDGRADAIRGLLPTSYKIDGRYAAVSDRIVLNWDEIVNLPDIQNRLHEYVDAYKIITKSWSYMKQKYSYKILEHGLF